MTETTATTQSIDRQAWLRSLKEGDQVKVFTKSREPFDSEIVNDKGKILVVKNAGIVLPGNSKSRDGRFSKLHGHRASHSPYAHWQDTDYIAPIQSAHDFTVSMPNLLVTVIADKEGNAVGYSIGELVVSKDEAKAILSQLQLFLKEE
jgi:hypothetical protein